tara:strand:- start:118 stop:1275 length:1158 start_codon:yes stop_codon:yes gene_type:complete
MINPYEGINWQSVMRIGSATHMHLTDQQALNNGYKYGIRHFPISNYYPSAPYDADTRPSDFRLRQHWSARRTDGGIVEPPVNWNDIITWQDELDEPYRSELPFTEGEAAFSNIPEDIILSPNAEHHGFTNSQAHICSPGSTFISGNIDPGGKNYRLATHGFHVGFGGTWQEAFEEMITHLKYPNAGGITINHPTWFSHFTDDQVFEMLHFDERVLGIEIYNDYSATRRWFEDPDYEAPSESETGFSLNMWDRILSTGRRCWGFCVPDHSVEKGTNWNGRNILLVSEFTEHDCLNAYRQGQFYGCLKDNGMTVTDVSATASAISIGVNTPATIKFITETGIASTVKGEHATYDIPQNDGSPGVVYVRIEVEDDSGERLFLQPVLYK